MKNETEVRTLIEIYKFRIDRDTKAMNECDKVQKESQRIYGDCGTMTHQIQIEVQIKQMGEMILAYKKDIEKWEKELQKEEKNLLYLINKND